MFDVGDSLAACCVRPAPLTRIDGVIPRKFKSPGRMQVLTYIRHSLLRLPHTTMASHDRRPDEETPLLEPRPKTPLPWGQISLIFLALVAEPVSSAYIFPFINQVRQQLFFESVYLTFTR